MYWRHIYSVLSSIVVTAILIITRPDFEDWYLLALAGGGGVTFYITLKFESRQQPYDPGLERAKLLAKMNRDQNMLQVLMVVGIVVAAVVMIGIVAVLPILFLAPDTIEMLVEAFMCGCKPEN